MAGQLQNAVVMAGYRICMVVKMVLLHRVAPMGKKVQGFQYRALKRSGQVEQQETGGSYFPVFF